MFIIYPGFNSIIVLSDLALSVGSDINFFASLSNQFLVPAPSRVSIDAGKLVFAVDFTEVGVVSSAIAIDPSNSVVAIDFAEVCIFLSGFSVDAGGFVVVIAFVELMSTVVLY